MNNKTNNGLLNRANALIRGAVLTPLLTVVGLLVQDLGAADIPFARVVIDQAHPVNPHCKSVGDIDGDGFIDVLAAGSTGDGLFWYRYPGWTKYKIASGSFTTDMQVADIDNDGDLDAIIPDGSGLKWYRNPRPNGDPARDSWVETRIGAAGANNHDVEVGDINRDGRLDVVTRKEHGGGTYVFIQNSPTSWTQLTVGTAPGEGIGLGDLDGDGDLDIAQNGFWLENPGHTQNVSWKSHTIDRSWPSRVGVLVVDLSRDGRNDVVLAPSESSNFRFAWYESTNPRGGPWTAHVIDPNVSFFHTFKAGDMDNDGDLDLVTAEMHQSADPDEVCVYRNQGGALSWSKQVLATTGSHNLRVADIGKDGDLDIIGANWNNAAPNGAPIELWENRLNPGSGPPPPTTGTYKRVSSSHVRTFGLCFPDVDRDGDLDIASGPFVYINPGSTLTGTWTQFALPGGSHASATLDVDSDTLADLITQQANGGANRTDLFWAEAANAAGTAWASPVSIGNVAGTRLQGFQGYRVGQFVPGGRPEIAVSSLSGIYYFSVPANPAAGSWPRTLVTSNDSDEGIGMADIDGDGDLDISFSNVATKQVRWARNPGNGTANWPVFTIGSFPEAYATDRCEAADLNGDGRVDIIVTEENPGGAPNAMACWWEQPAGGATSANWTRHVITTQYTMNSLDVGDVDRDGDIDVVLAEHRGTRRLAVWDNNGRGGFTQRLIDQGKESHLGGRLADLDGDGDLDLVSIAYDAFNELHIWRNDNPTGGSDTIRPTLSSVTALNANTVRVLFSEPVLTASASVSGNYSINKGITISSAVLGADTRTVTLTTSSMAEGNYILSVANVADRATPPNTILGNSQAEFTIATVRPLPTGVPTADLALWLRADAGVIASGSAVSQWQDQSGNGVHANQPQNSSQPAFIASAISGQPALRFDGLDDFMTFLLPINNLGEMTILMVAANTADQSEAHPYQRAALFWNETAFWGSSFLTPRQSDVTLRFGTTQAGNSPVYTRPASVGSNFTLTTAVKQGTTDSLYVNRTLVLTQGGKLPTITGARSTGNLGRGHNDNTFYIGDIAEVVIYGRALTPAELQAVEQYMDSRYGLTTTPAPRIISPPSNLTVTKPAAAMFSVLASGTAPLSYQWQQDGVNIGGASANSYTLNPTTAADNGAQFAVVVSNAAGSVTSGVATLTVNAPNPNSRVTGGLVVLYDFSEKSGTTVHDVSGVGSPLDLTILDPARVQWLGTSSGVRFVSAGSAIRSAGAGTKIHNALTASSRLSFEAWLTPDSLDQSGPARIATLSEGTASSQMNLHVGQGAASSGGGNIASFRLRTSANSFSWLQAGGSFNSTVNARHVVVTYDGTAQRIYMDGTLMGSAQALSGNYSNWTGTYPFVLGNEATLDRSWLGRMYLVALYDRALSLQEVQQNFAAGLQVGSALPEITTHPAPQTVVAPAAAMFSVAANGTAPLTYQWRRNGVNIGGASANSYTLNPTTAADNGAQFAVVVSNAAGSTTSGAATLTVTAPNPNSRVTGGLVVLYDFSEKSGTTVHDVSGVGSPLDLTILDPASVQWLGTSNGVRFVSAGSAIRSPGAGTKIHNALTASSRLSFEAWLTPDSLAQIGPARIATLSEGTAPSQMNLNVGQGGGSSGGDIASFRLRTSANSFSWLQADGSFNSTVNARHVVVTYDGTAQRVYMDGVPMGSVQALSGIFSNWTGTYPFVLGNEATLDRSWLGRMYLVALYDRALSLDEVQQNFAAGPKVGSAQPEIPVTAEQVATPTLTPNGGSFTGPATITLQSATSGATVRYTLDGTDPGASSLLYTGPFQLTSSATVSARGIKSGLTDSTVVSATFAISAPPPAPEVPTANLALWLQADAGVIAKGSAVSQWQDQSGNSLHANQTQNSSQPAFLANAINGRPAVRFDGMDDFLSFELPVNGLTGLTLCLVSASTTDHTGGQNEAENAALFWNETQSWGTVYLSPFQSQALFRFGTTQVNNHPTYSRPASTGPGYSLSIAVKNGATDSLYVDGTLALREDGKLTSIAGCQSTGNLGRGHNNNTYFSGQIAEVLVYRRALTDVERQSLEAYLRTKYFVVAAAPLPAGPANFRMDRLPTGERQVLAQGVPGQIYNLLQSTDLVHWKPLSSQTASSDGIVEFLITEPPNKSSQFFQLRTTHSD